MPKYSTVGRRQHDNMFKPLKGRKGVISHNGRNLYIPYQKAQNALMHIMNTYLTTFLVGNEPSTSISLKGILPQEGGEFGGNTMFKVIRELKACGFEGEEYKDWNTIKRESEAKNMYLDFTNSTNSDLIERYIDLYDACGHFKFVDAEGVRHHQLRSFEDDQKVVTKKLSTEELPDLYGTVIGLSDYDKEVSGKKQREYIKSRAVGRMNLAQKLWAYLHPSEWKVLELPDSYNSSGKLIVGVDFSFDKMFVDIIKTMMAVNCFGGTSQNVKVDSIYRTKVTVSNKDNHIPKLKGIVLELQAVIDHFSNMTVETIFTPEAVDKSIADVIKMLEYYNTDFKPHEQLESTSLSNVINEDEYDSIMLKVQQGLDRAKVSDKQLLELRNTLELSLKIQKVA